MEFVCVEETETSVTHLLEATDATKKAWPYEFQLYITHTLNGRDLTVAWKVVNKDQEIMYFIPHLLGRRVAPLSFRT